MYPTISCMVLMMDWCNGFKWSSNAAARLITGARWRDHIACSPAAALASSLPMSSVQAGCASVQSAAWASPTVLDGRLSTRCRCRSTSTTVIWRRHMFSATDPHVPRRSCVWCCWTTSAERFADQPSSASPLTWIVLTGAKNAFIWLCLQGLVTFCF